MQAEIAFNRSRGLIRGTQRNLWSRGKKKRVILWLPYRCSQAPIARPSYLSTPPKEGKAPTSNNNASQFINHRQKFICKIGVGKVDSRQMPTPLLTWQNKFKMANKSPTIRDRWEKAMSLFIMTVPGSSMILLSKSLVVVGPKGQAERWQPVLKLSRSRNRRNRCTRGKIIALIKPHLTQICLAVWTVKLGLILFKEVAAHCWWTRELGRLLTQIVWCAVSMISHHSKIATRINNRAFQLIQLIRKC